MKANQAELPVQAMCKTLRVSHSGYYDWLERPACARAQANVVLLGQIRQAHADSDVGWAFGQQQTADLVIAALTMALITRKPQGVIHHCRSEQPVHQRGLRQTLQGDGCAPVDGQRG